MDNLTDIKQAVSRGNFSTSDLQSLIIFTRTVISKQTKAGLNVGDEVTVIQKTKRTPGVVTQIKRTRASVRMRGSTYSVPLSMIEVA